MNRKLNEVEIKYSINDTDISNLIVLIKQHEGMFVKKQTEVDVYFNVSGRDSMSTKECLRVRSVLNENRSFESGEITYKPPSTASDKDFFSKKESNLSISDANMAIKLLESMGNDVLVHVIKDRSYFVIDDCNVVIDIVKNAGVFVEVEVLGLDRDASMQKIQKVAEILNLKDRVIEKRPYRDIVIINSMEE